MTKSEFIEKAREIHGDKYGYEMIYDGNYENYNNVPISCVEHGVFYQSVYDHLVHRLGCPKCGKKI